VQTCARHFLLLLSMLLLLLLLADKGFANKNEWHGDKVGDE